MSGRSVERALNCTSSTLPLPWAYEFVKRMQEVVGPELMPYGIDGGFSNENMQPIRDIVGREPITTRQFVEDHKAMFS